VQSFAASRLGTLDLAKIPLHPLLVIFTNDDCVSRGAFFHRFTKGIRAEVGSNHSDIATKQTEKGG
jgi:hypothetical protein